ATDVDHNATQIWSVNTTAGTYGTFAIDASTGQWTYTLDNSLAATQALKQGETQTDTFTATVTDDQLATDTIKVKITVHGSNDAPVIGARSIVTGAVTEAGDLPGIDEAGLGGGLTLTAALSASLASHPAVAAELSGLATHPADVHNTLLAIEAGLGVDVPTAIAIVWHSLDAAYVSAGPNQSNINEAFARLGVEYAAYVKADGVPLVDVVAKYTADANNDGIAERDQSLHDNLLGNLTTAALSQHFSGNPGLLTTLTGLISGVDAGLLNRPYASGNEGSTGGAAAHLFDVAKGFGTAARGTLVATDVDHNATQTWSVNTTAGTYGTFAIDASTGKWTYTLDNSLAATQALKQGETQSDTFPATVTDDQLATDTINVKITVHGSNDAPVIGGASIVTGAGTEAGDLPGIDEAGLGGGLTLTAALSASLASHPAVASELSGLA